MFIGSRRSHVYIKGGVAMPNEIQNGGQIQNDDKLLALQASIYRR